MKTPKVLGLLLLASALALSMGCANTIVGGVVIERNEVAHLKVTTVKGSQGLELQISGLPMNSAEVVVSVREKKRGNQINILVREALMSSLNRGKTGNLSYTLKVPDDVDTVTFGKKQTVIWKRPGR